MVCWHWWLWVVSYSLFLNMWCKICNWRWLVVIGWCFVAVLIITGVYLLYGILRKHFISISFYYRNICTDMRIYKNKFCVVFMVVYSTSWLRHFIWKDLRKIEHLIRQKSLVENYTSCLWVWILGVRTFLINWSTFDTYLYKNWIYCTYVGMTNTHPCEQVLCIGI